MEITEIKQRLSIMQVLNHYNLTPNHNNLLQCCFHADKTASLQIYPQTNTFHCFGCGKTGDQIEFIQQKEGITKHQAILKAKTMINGSEIVKNEKLKIKSEEIHDFESLYQSFKQSIQNSPKAQDYCKQRNLDIVKLGIGYNTDRKWNHMKNCIIFPLRNKENEIVSFYGRSILNESNESNEKNEKIGKHFYLKDRQGLYPNYPKPETEILILTEAVIDCATLINYELGIKNYELLSLYGTNGLTKEHETAIAEWLAPLGEMSEGQRGKEIIIFFDGDNAGREGIKMRFIRKKRT